MTEQLLSVAVDKAVEVVWKKLEKGERLKVEDLVVILIATIKDVYGGLERLREFIDHRVAEIHLRIDRLNDRIGETEERILETNKRIDTLGAELNARIAETNKRIDVLVAELNARIDETN
ncbi:MAG: hypothetical protein QXH65_06200, partial [Thermofilaceae archaeon]